MKANSFKDIKSLREYEERNEIVSLKYKGTEMIEKGDLPEGGSLDSLELIKRELLKIEGSAIPHGLKNIKFPFSVDTPTPHYSTLPTTIECIEGYYPTEQENETLKPIPSNIKSISFSYCKPQITKDTFQSSSLTNIDFGHHFKNGGKTLQVGELPNSLTSLSIQGYSNILNENVIPNSVTYLQVGINGISDGGIVKKDVIPNSVTKLLIHLQSDNLTIGSESIPNSVTDLEIHFNKSSNIEEYGGIPKNVTRLILCGCYVQLTDKIFTDANNENIKYMFLEYNSKKPIQVGSLPKSLTTLEIGKLKYPLEQGIFPNSITSLIFKSYSSFNQPINQHGILPTGLQHLEINEYYPIDDFIEMIDYLPSSLTSLCLPADYDDEDVTSKLPKTINNITFKEEWDC